MTDLETTKVEDGTETEGGAETEGGVETKGGTEANGEVETRDEAKDEVVVNKPAPKRSAAGAAIRGFVSRHYYCSKEARYQLGWTFATVFLVILAILVGKNGTISPKLVFTLFGINLGLFIITPFARALNVIWMGISFGLLAVNTRIILFMVFYLLLFPLSLVMKLTGRDRLSIRSKMADTGWVERVPHPRGAKHCRRPF